MALSLFGFYNGLSEQARGYPYLQRYGNLLDGIGLFQVAIQSNGELSELPSKRLINEAREMGIKVYLVLTNLTPQGRFSTPILTRLIRDERFASTVKSNLRNVLNQYRFDGVNFDLEKAAPQDRNAFTQFVYFWTRQLKQENYLVTMDVPAKTWDEPTDVWKGAYDYRALGQIVDAIILMTYEEHWPASPPGSVASLPWTRQVLDYALQGISAQKVYMGVPIYGYDWVEGGSGKVVSHRRALELFKRFGAPLLWDNLQRSTYFRYESMGKRHTVYFEDLRSLREKLDLAQQHQIRGIALWEMNLSYPDLYETLRPYARRR